MKKRVLRLFVALTLCLTLLSTAVFAETGTGVILNSETTTVSVPAQDGDSSNAGTAAAGDDQPSAPESLQEGDDLSSVPGSLPEGGGVYVPPGGPTEGGGGTYIPGEDTRTEIWRDTQRFHRISRPYDGTTDGGTVSLILEFTDGTNELELEEGTDFTAVKTFDSPDAGDHTVTVTIALTGEAAEKYKLREGEETFTIDGTINKAYPDLTVSLLKTTCTVGEKLLPLLSVDGVPEDAEVTYYYLASEFKSWAGSSDVEGSEAMPKIDESTAISEPGTYYVYVKTAETKNYEEKRSQTVEFTVREAVVETASVTRADGTEGGAYDSLPAALNAAQDGDTVKLLASHTTDWSAVEAGEAQMAVVRKRLTLDLNGKTVDYLAVGEVVSDEEGGILDSADGDLTVMGSRAGTGTDGEITRLDFVRGTLSIQDGVTIGKTSDSSVGLACKEDSGEVAISGGKVCGVRLEGAGASVTVSGGSMHAGSWINDGGTLNIEGGTFGSVRFRNNGGAIAISGGTFGAIQNLDEDSSNIPPMLLLAQGYAFYTDNIVQDGSRNDCLAGVTVKEHTHTMVDNKCACGLSCTHTNTEGAGTIGEDGKCTVCGTQFAAVIDGTYYADAKSALEAAADGQTVKLLADATLPDANMDLNTSLALDLNGYVLGSNGSFTVKSGAALTVANAGGANTEKPIRVGLYLKLLVEKGGSFTCTDGGIRYLGLLSEGTGDYNIKLADGESHSTFISFSQCDETAAVGDLLKANHAGMALHAGNSGSDVQIARSTCINQINTGYMLFYVGTCSVHKISADSACIYCGASYVASVTTGSGTTSYMTTLSDAIFALKGGDTLTLLADVDVGSGLKIDRSNITFDLNGHKLYSTATSGFAPTLSIEVESAASVTLKNGTIETTWAYTQAIQAWMPDGELRLEKIVAKVPDNSNQEAVYLEGSGLTATIVSGDYQGLYLSPEVTAVLEGGTFRPYQTWDGRTKYSVFHQLSNSGDSSRDCMELLAEGCVYVDEDGKQVRTYGGFNYTVTVQKAAEQPTEAVAMIDNKPYHSLREAIEAVKSGETIMLLQSLDLGSGVVQLEEIDKDFTIDLGNHELKANAQCLVYMVTSNSHVTIQNGTLDGSSCANSVIFVRNYLNGSPRLTLKNVTATSGNSLPVVQAVAGGTVEFDGGSYTGGVLVGETGSAVLKKGTFRKGDNSYSIKTTADGKHLSDYLDTDSQFWKNNAVSDLSGAAETVDDVTVRPCGHNWVNGTCSICKKKCDHGMAEDKSMTAAACSTCGMKAAAQVDIIGSDAKYFLALDNALACAAKNDGCTLKLLADEADTKVTIDTPFLFDLNGHDVQELSVGAKAKIRDSGRTKGRIGRVAVFDKETEETNRTLGDLLEEGYAFRYENGYWADDYGVQTASPSSVTVEKAPIQSVAVFAKDKNQKEVPTTMAYGTTGQVTLVASCRLSETSGEDLSCAWYKITDDMAIPPLAGETGTSYTLPADLPAGEHTYRVTFTSDHYSKSAEITIIVQPISIEGAAVEVKNPTYNGNKQAPAVTVRLNENTTLKETDYIVDVAMQTDAGSYTLTVTGTGNYSGEIRNVEWKITPMKIDHVMVSSDISKVYDGTAAIMKTAEEWAEILAFKTHSVPDTVTVPSSAYTISDVRFIAKNAEGEFVDSPQAGDKSIHFTITFQSNNYVLQTAYDEQPASSKSYNQSGGANFTIEQAVIDLSRIEFSQYVFNDLAKTYEIELQPLLNEVLSQQARGCEYGEIAYGMPRIDMKTEYYNMETGAKVENGRLILPIKAAGSVPGGTRIGIATVEVSSTNYQTFHLPLYVIVRDKLVPDSKDVKVSAADITYGQTLSDSRLTVTGTMKDPITGDEIKGRFAWKDSAYKPIAGGNNVDWIFIPDAPEYAAATGKVYVMVNRRDITGAVVTLENSSFVYDGTSKRPELKSVVLDGVTLNYGKDFDYDYGYSSGSDAGTYNLSIQGYNNYSGEITVEWKITARKVTPAIVVADGVYNGGKEVKPKVTLTDDLNNIIDEKEYSVSYENNINAGIGRVTIKDVAGGNYDLVGFSQDFRINKADAPGNIRRGTLDVINDNTADYDVPVYDLLPELEAGETFGTVTYGTPAVDLKDGYTASGIVVDKNGMLAVVVAAPDVRQEGAIGTITVPVTTTNYKTFHLIIDVNARNKIVPQPNGAVSASAITYGQTLGESLISGKMKDPAAGTEIKGVLAWKDGTIRPDAGSHEAEWVFTPDASYLGRYAAAAGTVIITVNPKDIAGAEVTLKSDRFTYDGTEKHPEVDSVVLDGKTLTGGAHGDYGYHYDLNPDVGTYELTVSGNHNYTGTVTVHWSITPRTVQDPVIGLSGNLTYTGNEVRPIVTLKDDLNHVIDPKEYEVSYKDNTDAGTATVTIKDVAGGNYVLGTVSAPFTIGKAAAPKATDQPAVTVINGLAKTYEMVLPDDSLPALASPCEYGSVSYSLDGIRLTDGYDASKAEIVEENGQYKLKLTVPAVDYDQEGSVGTLQLRVLSDNYQDFALVIEVKTKNKIVPEPDGTVSAAEITYGQTLEASTIVGRMKDGSKTVNGTFAWANGTVRPNAGSYDAEWTFTPDESYGGIYAAAAGKVTIRANPKTVRITDITAEDKVYDGTTAATLDCSRAVLEGRLEGDDLTVAAAGVFRQADAGREKALVVDLSITLTGKDKDNYVIDDANSQRDTSAYITPATLIVTPDADQSKVFASAEPALTYTVSGAANGEIPVFTGALARAEGENVGTYAITPGSLALKSGGSFRADNYDWKLSDAVVRFTISKAPAPVLKDIAVSQTYTMTAGTVRLSGQMPSDAGTLTYTPGNAGTTGFVAVSSWRVDADTAEVSYTLSDGAAGDTVTLPVTISSANYEDAVVHVVITLTARDDQAVLAITGSTSVVYGQTLKLTAAGGSGSGAVTYRIDKAASTGEAVIDPRTGVLTPVRVGSVSIIAAKAGDGDYNAVISAPYVIMIIPATPTGEPRYTPITTSGKTLKDAGLTLTGSTLKPDAGRLEWVDDKGNALSDDTVVEANRTYKWRFTPDDGNYASLTGEVRLYPVSSGDGSGCYIIKAIAGAGGRISPSGDVSVGEGGNQTFTFTPDKGYAVSNVRIDGQSIGAAKSYTFKNVSTPHTIEVIFMKANGNPQTGVFVDAATGSCCEDAADQAVKTGIPQGAGEPPRLPGRYSQPYAGCGFPAALCEVPDRRYRQSLSPWKARRLLCRRGLYKSTNRARS